MTGAREDGFTLVEMLVALALLALIVSGIAGGVQLGRIVWQRDADLEWRGAAEAASRGIAVLVGAAYPAAGALEDGRPRALFDGRSGALRFVALSEGHAQPGGLIATEIGLEDGPHGPRLMVWTAPYRAESVGRLTHANMHANMHASEIVGRVRLLTFSYYGAGGDGGQPEWRSAWAGHERLPQLIAIRLELEARGGVIAVPATVEIVQR